LLILFIEKIDILKSPANSVIPDQNQSKRVEYDRGIETGSWPVSFSFRFLGKESHYDCRIKTMPTDWKGFKWSLIFPSPKGALGHLSQT